MKYLLDVNALIALGFEPHEFHRRVVNWSAKNAPEVATCSITELGFVRVLSQAARYGLSVTEAQSLLLRLKGSKAMTFRFVADDHDLSYMPSWVKRPEQTTDGHLLELARAKRGSLATLDRRIPGAFVIPES